MYERLPFYCVLYCSLRALSRIFRTKDDRLVLYVFRFSFAQDLFHTGKNATISCKARKVLGDAVSGRSCDLYNSIMSSDYDKWARFDDEKCMAEMDREETESVKWISGPQHSNVTKGVEITQRNFEAVESKVRCNSISACTLVLISFWTSTSALLSY